jgi:hypothetical protein
MFTLGGIVLVMGVALLVSLFFARKTIPVCAELTTFCPATFLHKGVIHAALMTSLSELGACFKELGQDCNLTPGESVNFRVKTPYGNAACGGHITWVGMVDGQHCWGIKFSQVAANPDDPLRALMGASF